MSKNAIAEAMREQRQALGLPKAGLSGTRTLARPAWWAPFWPDLVDTGPRVTYGPLRTRGVNYPSVIAGRTGLPGSLPAAQSAPPASRIAGAFQAAKPVRQLGSPYAPPPVMEARLPRPRPDYTAVGSRAEIAAMQRDLNARGANLPVDGIIGPLTRAAVLKYGDVTQPAAPAYTSTAPATTPALQAATTQASGVPARLPQPRPVYSPPPVMPTARIPLPRPIYPQVSLPLMQQLAERMRRDAAVQGGGTRSGMGGYSGGGYTGGSYGGFGGGSIGTGVGGAFRNR